MSKVIVTSLYLYADNSNTSVAVFYYPAQCSYGTNGYRAETWTQLREWAIAGLTREKHHRIKNLAFGVTTGFDTEESCAAYCSWVDNMLLVLEEHVNNPFAAFNLGR